MFDKCQGATSDHPQVLSLALTELLLMKFTDSNVALCRLPTVFNLTNNFDVENTKLRMEQYQRENRDVIQRNKAKLVRTKISDLYTSFYTLNYWCAKAKNKRKPLFGPRFRVKSRVKYDSPLPKVGGDSLPVRGAIAATSALCPAPLRRASRRSWRSCCSWSSRATSSGGWTCCRKSRGSCRPRRRTSRLFSTNWWETCCMDVFVPAQMFRASRTHTHTHTHAHCLRVHDCDIIKSLLPVIVVRPAIVLILRFQSLSAPLFWAVGFGSDCSCGVGCRRAIADSTLSSVFVCLRHRACWL